MKLSEAYEQIRAADAQFQEQSADPGALLVESGALVVGERQFPLRGKALEQLCRAVKAPPAYIGALDPELQAHLLNYHIGRGDIGRDAISLMSRGPDLVALGRVDLVRLQGHEVLEAVQRGIGQAEADLDVAGLTLADGSSRINLVVHKAAREVVPGDVIQGGVQVSYSPVGAFAARVEGYVLRLVCRNGMTHRECVDPHHSRATARTRRLPVGHPDAKRLQVQQISRLTAGALSAIEEKLQGLTVLTVEHVDFDQLTRTWLQRVRLSPDRLVPVLRRAWEAEGAEPSAYSVMNAFTRAATHDPDLSPRVRDVFARLGGLLAFRHRHLCPRCFALVSADQSRDSAV
jgi:hypothetical protein